MILDDSLLRRLQLVLTGRLLRHATGVERTHRELGAGLTDGLGRDDPNGHSLFHESTGRHIGTVALGTDAPPRLARERTANANLVEAEIFNLGGHLLGDDLVFGDDQHVTDRIADAVASHATDNALSQRDGDFLAFVDGLFGDPVDGAAIIKRHDDVLSDIRQLARQVTGVGGFQRGVGQPLACAVRGAEVLEYGKTFTKVRLDRRLNNLPGRLGHQRPHARQLADLIDTTSGAGFGHEVDGVQIRFRARIIR